MDNNKASTKKEPATPLQPEYEVSRTLTAGADELVYSPSRRGEHTVSNKLKDKMAAFSGSGTVTPQGSQRNLMSKAHKQVSPQSLLSSPSSPPGVPRRQSTPSSSSGSPQRLSSPQSPTPSSPPSSPKTRSSSSTPKTPPGYAVVGDDAPKIPEMPETASTTQLQTPPKPNPTESDEYEVSRTLTAGADELVYSPRSRKAPSSPAMKDKLAVFGGHGGKGGENAPQNDDDTPVVPRVTNVEEAFEPKKRPTVEPNVAPAEASTGGEKVPYSPSEQRQSRAKSDSFKAKLAAFGGGVGSGGSNRKIESKKVQPKTKSKTRRELRRINSEGTMEDEEENPQHEPDRKDEKKPKRRTKRRNSIASSSGDEYEGDLAQEELAQFVALYDSHKQTKAAAQAQPRREKEPTKQPKSKKIGNNNKNSIPTSSNHTTDTYPSFFGDEMSLASESIQSSNTASLANPANASLQNRVSPANKHTGPPRVSSHSTASTAPSSSISEVATSPVHQPLSTDKLSPKQVHSGGNTGAIDQKEEAIEEEKVAPVVADEAQPNRDKEAQEVTEPAVFAKKEKRRRRRNSYNGTSSGDEGMGGNDTEDEYEQGGGYRGTFMDWNAQQRAISRRRKKPDSKMGAKVSSARDLFDNTKQEKTPAVKPRSSARSNKTQPIPVLPDALGEDNAAPSRTLESRVASARDLFENNTATTTSGPSKDQRPARVLGGKVTSARDLFERNARSPGGSTHSSGSSVSNKKQPDVEPSINTNKLEKVEERPAPKLKKGAEPHEAAREVRTRRRRNSHSGASSGEESDDGGGNTTEDEYQQGGGYRGTFMDFDAQQRAIARKREKRRGGKKSEVMSKATSMFEKTKDDAPTTTSTLARRSKPESSRKPRSSKEGRGSRRDSMRRSQSDAGLSSDDDEMEDITRKARTKRRNSFNSQDGLYKQKDDDAEGEGTGEASGDDYGGMGYRGCLLDFNAQQRAIARNRKQTSASTESQRRLQERLAIFQK